MYRTTYADVLRPASRTHALYYNIFLAIGGSLFVALCAQFSLRLPFSPVPVTAQTLAVLLVGTLMGSKLGALAMLTYLLEGAAGLPVFAGGSAGLLHLVGPTGGYLIGFVVAAFITGKLAELGWDRRIMTVLPAMLLGTAAIFILGLSWLTHFVGNNNVLQLGLYPYIPGAIIKIALAAILLPSGWKILKLRR